MAVLAYNGYVLDVRSTAAAGYLCLISDTGGAPITWVIRGSELDAVRAGKAWVDLQLAWPGIRTWVVPLAAGSFSVGTLLSITGSGVALATNATAGRRADLVVVADDDDYSVTAARGYRLYVPSHGIAGAGTRLWLGTSGGYATSEPGGASVHVIQEVGTVYDTDHLVLTFNPPVLDA